MTETTTQEATESPETDETPKPGTGTQEETTEAHEGTEGTPNREAAKWRVKLREAEGRVSELETTVQTLQAAEARRLATGPGRLHDGDDVFRTTALADLLTDDGTVDQDKVTAAVDELRQSKPHLASPAFGDDVGQGERDNTPTTSWAAVLKS